MKLFKYSTIIAGLLSLFLLAGCMPPHMQLADIKDLKKNEALYAIKVSFNPHIKKDEIDMSGAILLGDAAQKAHRSLYLKASEKFYRVGAGDSEDFSDSIPIIEGEYAFFPWPKDKPLNILGTWFYTAMASRRRETMMYTITDGINVQSNKHPRVIYIGDITFKRDEFFNIKDINITQKNRGAAQAAFQKRYKVRWKLEPAKLSAAK